jgi:hypothetical protein
MHWFPEQQPSGQEVAPQAWHTPLLQAGVWVGHCWQGAPLTPQARGVCWVTRRHTLPEQHPVQFVVLQVPPLQTPFEQTPGAAQGWQLTPPVPQAVAPCWAYRMQVVPLQQPYWQLVQAPPPPQTPFTHCAVPQERQTAPAVPQKVWFWFAGSRHWPCGVQHPVQFVLLQTEPVQVPFVHWPVPQDPQGAPRVPHCALFWEVYCMHCPWGVQQPEAQLELLHELVVWHTPF